MRTSFASTAIASIVDAASATSAAAICSSVVAAAAAAAATPGISCRPVAAKPPAAAAPRARGCRRDAPGALPGGGAIGNAAGVYERYSAPRGAPRALLGVAGVRAPAGGSTSDTRNARAVPGRRSPPAAPGTTGGPRARTPSTARRREGRSSGREGVPAARAAGAAEAVDGSAVTTSAAPRPAPRGKDADTAAPASEPLTASTRRYPASVAPAAHRASHSRNPAKVSESVRSSDALAPAVGAAASIASGRRRAPDGELGKIVSSPGVEDDCSADAAPTAAANASASSAASVEASVSSPEARAKTLAQRQSIAVASLQPPTSPALSPAENAQNTRCAARAHRVSAPRTRAYTPTSRGCYAHMQRTGNTKYKICL